MKVRDRRFSINKYKGHEIEAGAGGLNCPYLPCWNLHNCYYSDTMGKPIDRWTCATNFNYGCPDKNDTRLIRPTHIFRPDNPLKRHKGQKKRCIRCGQKVILGNLEFNFIIEKKADAE